MKHLTTKFNLESYRGRWEKIVSHNEVTLEDFAKSFGTTIDDLPRNLITETDFRYKRLNVAERDELIQSILRKIENVNPTAKLRWEKGWAENLQSFVDSGYRIEALIPKYIRPNQPVRLRQEYVIPCNVNFEHYYIEAFRLWLFRTYFQSVNSIYDFGCGTGYNLAVLARLFPDKKLYGLDWAEASQKIVCLIAKYHNMNIEARSFNFYTPNDGLEIADNSAVMTFAALEQVGSDYESFLQYILKQTPALCVNVEPLYELYDENNLVDYLAIKYHGKRNYLNGYLSRLKQLESEGKIEILKVQRLYFGSLYHEAYSYVIWKPKGVK